MAKFVKVEAGENPCIDVGAKVRVRKAYLNDGEKAVKYYVAPLHKGYCLLADSKKDFDGGMGYIYSVWCIEAYERL